MVKVIVSQFQTLFLSLRCKCIEYDFTWTNGAMCPMVKTNRIIIKRDLYFCNFAHQEKKKKWQQNLIWILVEWSSILCFTWKFSRTFAAFICRTEDISVMFTLFESCVWMNIEPQPVHLFNLLWNWWKCNKNVNIKKKNPYIVYDFLTLIHFV